MANSTDLKLGMCYEIVKADGTKIPFKFLGGEPPIAEVIFTKEKISVIYLLDKVTNFYEIICP